MSLRDYIKDSDRYVKVVEWSETDTCYVCSCSGLLYGGCHGDDQNAVFDELCQIVDETVELYRKDAKALPAATAVKDLAGLLRDVA